MAAALLGAYATAGASAWLVTPGAAGRALALLALMLGAATAWDRGLLRGRRAPRAIELRADGQASVETTDGQRLDAAMGGRYVSRLGVILELRHAMRRHLIVAGDMLDEDDFRRLRQWALWRGAAAGRPAAGS